MTILVGYIPTSEGLAAIDKAIDRAQRDQQKLIVVNSGHPQNTGHPNYATEQDLDALVARLNEAGLEHDIRQHTTATDIADVILDEAEDVKADLIVIGVRRRTPVGKLVAGSTAQKILLEAGCDVLAVKAAKQA